MTSTPTYYFGVSPGHEVDRFYQSQAPQLSFLCPDIQDLSARSPAHITIVSPFPCESLGALHAVADEVARELHPFALEFEDLGSFGTETLYLGVRQNPLLEELMRLLNMRLVEARLMNKPTVKRDFVPHVSLARHLDEESYGAAQAFFEGAAQHFLPARVEDFRLYRLEVDHYIVERIYPLE